MQTPRTVVHMLGQNMSVSEALEDAIETLLGREIVDESDTVEDMQELARHKYRKRLRDGKAKPATRPGDQACRIPQGVRSRFPARSRYIPSAASRP